MAFPHLNMLKTNNDYLNALLIILLIFVMIQQLGILNRLKGYNVEIPQNIQQLYEDKYLLPNHYQELSKHQQLTLLQHAQMIRRISKSTPIQIVRYQVPKDYLERYTKCYHQQPRTAACASFIRIGNERPRLVQVPKNAKPMILILHSDIPVQWQFGSDHKDAKLLFMTGSLPSVIRGSTFTSKVSCLTSFEYKDENEEISFCHETMIQGLQKFNDIISYQLQVEKIFQRKPQELVVLGKS